MKILSNFKPYPEAAYEVSPQALEFFLQSGDDRSDIRTHSHISNCIVFHAKNFENSVLSDHIIAMRKRIDQIVSDRVKDLFRIGKRLSVDVSGHFLYPPGGYMGWHTNSRVPGWRMYVNYVEEPGKSFLIPVLDLPATNSV